MFNLSGELRKQEEFSQEIACLFISTDMNTVVEKDPDQPIDMEAHFQWMLNIVDTAARSDSTLDYALSYRKQGSAALADLISFANSDRQHTSK